MYLCPKCHLPQCQCAAFPADHPREQIPSADDICFICKNSILDCTCFNQPDAICQHGDISVFCVECLREELTEILEREEAQSARAAAAQNSYANFHAAHCNSPKICERILRARQRSNTLNTFWKCPFNGCIETLKPSVGQTDCTENIIWLTHIIKHITEIQKKVGSSGKIHFEQFISGCRTQLAPEDIRLYVLGKHFHLFKIASHPDGVGTPCPWCKATISPEWCKIAGQGPTLCQRCYKNAEKPGLCEICKSQSSTTWGRVAGQGPMLCKRCYNKAEKPGLCEICKSQSSTTWGRVAGQGPMLCKRCYNKAEKPGLCGQCKSQSSTTWGRVAGQGPMLCQRCYNRAEKPGLCGQCKVESSTRWYRVKGQGPTLCSSCYVKAANIGRAWICLVCSKVFQTKQSLTRHSKAVHEKVKDYLCGWCSKSFPQSENRNRHEKKCPQKGIPETTSLSTTTLLPTTTSLPNTTPSHKCTKGCKAVFASPKDRTDHEKKHHQN